MNTITRHQKALLTACAEDYECLRDGVLVSGEFAEHAAITAISLQQRGWVSIRTTDWGDRYANFTTDQYADWREWAARRVA